MTVTTMVSQEKEDGSLADSLSDEEVFSKH